MVLHLSGFAAPLVLGLGLYFSGTGSEETADYWLADLIGNPNASYFAQPAGFLYAGVIFVLAAGIFMIFPVWLWRRLYRSRDILVRDWSSVDSAFTLAFITALVWIFRVVAGYSDSIGSMAVVTSVLAGYVPIFSAALAVAMPVVPGGGRIGGILPGFLRIQFTERVLFTDDEREQLRVFKEAGKQASRRANEPEASDGAGESDDPQQD